MMTWKALPARVGKLLWSSLTLLVSAGVAVALTRIEPGYNHVFGAYLLTGLVLFNLKLWFGQLSIFNLIFLSTCLTLCLWMLATGNADVVPYLLAFLLGSSAAVVIARLLLRRPLTFRDDSRVAENYLDMSVRALVTVIALVTSLRLMPRPSYILTPVLIVVGFKLAYPLRRLIYPPLLRLAGLEPTSGRARPAAQIARGSTPAKGWILAASLAIGLLVLPLLATPVRYDVTVPALYVLPADLLAQRRAELEPYVATAPGSFDPKALVELGLIYHNLGLSDELYLERAAAVLDRALFLDPDNARGLAWHGSNEVAFALHEWRPTSRMRHISRGLDELGRAVRMAPDDPEVLLARIDICLGVPRFIGLIGIAKRDMDHLLALTRSRPRDTAEILPAIHQRAGDIFDQLGRPQDARCHWRAALEMLPPESSDYRKIAGELRLLGPEPSSEGQADAGTVGRVACLRDGL